MIFSHSSAKASATTCATCPTTCSQMLPKNGGVVMVTFVAAFVSQEVATASEPLWAEMKARAKEVKDPAELQKLYKEMAAKMPKIKVTIAQVADHVDHVAQARGRRPRRPRRRLRRQRRRGPKAWRTCRATRSSSPS